MFCLALIWEKKPDNAIPGCIRYKHNTANQSYVFYVRKVQGTMVDKFDFTPEKLFFNKFLK